MAIVVLRWEFNLNIYITYIDLSILNYKSTARKHQNITGITGSNILWNVVQVYYMSNLYWIFKANTDIDMKPNNM